MSAPVCSTAVRAPRALELIGAPSDCGANLAGACGGPQALRAAGLVPALRALGLQVHDGGYLRGPARPAHSTGTGMDIRTGCHHLAEVLVWNRRVYRAVAAALSAGRVPVLLGGDHSLAIGSISAVAQHCQAQGLRLRVLWVDAHADANTPATSPSGNLHGMPVAYLLGDGPPALRALAGASPALQGTPLYLMGLRSLDAHEQHYLQAHGVASWSMAQLRAQGVDAVIAQVLHGVDATTHLHLSLDVDCLDPRIAPGVSTPVPRGLRLRTLQRCLALLRASGAVGSLDVMELNPARDVRHQTAQRVVQALQSLWAEPTRAQ